jgi:serine protease Do
MKHRRYTIALIFWAFLIGLAVMWGAMGVMNRAAALPETSQDLAKATGEYSEPMWHQYQQTAMPAITQTNNMMQQDRSNAIVNAVGVVSPAVVSIGIVVEYRYLRPSYRDYFGRMYGGDKQKVTQKYPKVGTGFLINSDGVIVTNHHVIDQGTDIMVTLQNGKEYEAELLGFDEALDIAVLKIEGNNLPYAVLGDDTQLVIGEWAIAIGNPYGSLLQDSQPTVTVGVISALDRQFNSSSEDGRYYQNMIQTDAAINPGNSGGPLVNARGEVIGVNTFIFSSSGGSIGLGFARPVNEIKRVVHELLTYGKIRRVNLGIGGRGLYRREVEVLNLPADIHNGVLVTYVAPGSPAEEAGLEQGDIIYSMDDIPVHSVNDASAKIETLTVGDVMKVELYRDGKRFSSSLRAREQREN